VVAGCVFSALPSGELQPLVHGVGRRLDAIYLVAGNDLGLHDRFSVPAVDVGHHDGFVGADLVVLRDEHVVAVCVDITLPSGERVSLVLRVGGNGARNGRIGRRLELRCSGSGVGLTISISDIRRGLGARGDAFGIAFGRSGITAMSRLRLQSRLSVGGIRAIGCLPRQRRLAASGFALGGRVVGSLRHQASPLAIFVDQTVGRGLVVLGREFGFGLSLQLIHVDIGLHDLVSRHHLAALVIQVIHVGHHDDVGRQVGLVTRIVALGDVRHGVGCKAV